MENKLSPKKVLIQVPITHNEKLGFFKKKNLKKNAQSQFPHIKSIKECLSFIMLQPLDSETGRTRDFWSKTSLLQ